MNELSDEMLTVMGKSKRDRWRRRINGHGDTIWKGFTTLVTTLAVLGVWNMNGTLARIETNQINFIKVQEKEHKEIRDTEFTEEDGKALKSELVIKMLEGRQDGEEWADARYVRK
ncbi:hypothetical protein LCGC14_0245290 [marine sediment metagenome]|uniref:Uncharacterized protein n=1 Tax=marine sediment metagenome TaxID=412755 RepID=A0A0F9XAE8_9ZZZZ